MVTGQVIDSVSNLPIPNATVFLGNKADLGNHNFTDHTGNFSFSDVLPGEYIIRAMANGYLSNSSPIIVVSGEIAIAELCLMPTGNITGVVTDAGTNDVIPGAAVLLSDDEGVTIAAVLTDTSGDYLFYLVKPGRYSLRVFAFGYNASSTSINVEAKDATTVDFQLTPNVIHLNLEVSSTSFSRGESVLFRVDALNAYGQPIADNITDVTIILKGPKDETVAIYPERVVDSFEGTYLIESNETMGIWTATAHADDVFGNHAEAVERFSVYKAFFVEFSANRTSCVEGDIVGFTAYVSRFSDTQRFLNSSEVSATVDVTTPDNTSIGVLNLTTSGNALIGSFNTSSLPKGVYVACLTVHDSRGNVETTFTAFAVVQDFRITVETDKSLYNRTEAVRIFGSLLYTNDTALPHTEVSLVLVVKNYPRTFHVTTDSSGFFEYHFTPLGVDAGNYTVLASCVKAQIKRSVTSHFAILGLAFEPSLLKVSMSENSTNSFVMRILNIGQTKLTGLTVVTSPSTIGGVTVVITDHPSNVLLPGASTSFAIDVAAEYGAMTYSEFSIIATCDQASIEFGYVRVSLYPATPVLQVAPQLIDTSIAPETHSTHTIAIENIGYRLLENASVTSSSHDWITISRTHLGDISPREVAVFDVLIHPPSSTAVGMIEDQITITSNNHVPVNVYILVKVTSAENGTLVFRVIDDTRVPVADAKITLQYQEYWLHATTTTTDSTGYGVFPSLSGGRYTYLVSAEGHETASGTLTVQPGSTVHAEVISPIQLMDVTFSVLPMTVEDQYCIVLNMAFETDIPDPQHASMPLLLPIPLVLQFKADRTKVITDGYDSTMYFNVYNTGSISIFDVSIDSERPLPEGYEIAFGDFGENMSIPEIRAEESVSIPCQLIVEPNVTITELPHGIVSKIVIEGSYVYFDADHIARTATVNAKVLIQIVDEGERRLCIDPPIIFGVNLNSVVSFQTPIMYGYSPSRLPDVTITNCAEIEGVYLYKWAAGGGFTVGIDLIDALIGAFTGSPGLGAIDLGYFISFGEISLFSPIPKDPIYQAEWLGLVEVTVPNPWHTILLHELVEYATNRDLTKWLYLEREETALLQSEIWETEVPTSWADLFQQIIGIRISLGLSVTVGYIGFVYKWQYDLTPTSQFIPIFIVDIDAPVITVPTTAGRLHPEPSDGAIPPWAWVGSSEDRPIQPPSVILIDPPKVPTPPEQPPVENIHEIVKLSISQEATLERDAFIASLQMTNKMPTTDIENVDVNLDIRFANGTNANQNFFVNLEDLQGISALDGSGIISPKATATAYWSLIPKPGAGGTSPTGVFYEIQAQIIYSVNQVIFNLASSNETINVKPQPLLVIDYYLPEEIAADQQFKLGVKVTNFGYGTARDFKIDSAQPVMYDNQAHLPIDFSLVGSFVRGSPISNSLKMCFGDIKPGESVVGYWAMTASRSGVFLDFDATFTHTNELGGAETSLIQSVTTHILMREVAADDPTFLFLIDTNNDGTPDELIDPVFGDGVTVVDVDCSAWHEPGAVAMTVQTQKYDGSWIWVEVDDPYNNQKPLLKIVRSDDKILNPLNYWMANHKIYFVDDPEVSYTIIYDFFDTDAPVTSASFAPQTPDGQNNWYTGPVAVTLTASDETSGVAAIYYHMNDGQPQTYTNPFTILDDGAYTIDFWSIDHASNVEPVKNVSFRIDQTDPITLLILGEPIYGIDPSYLSASTSITLDAADATSGIDTTEYRIDAGAWIPYSAPFTLTTFGSHTIYHRSIDMAGNTEPTKTTTVFLDENPPTTTLTIGEPKYVAETTSVTNETTFTLAADDNLGSGPAQIGYRIINTTYDSSWLPFSVPFQLTTLADGIYSIEFNSTDNVGNMEPSHTATIILDNSGPLVVVENPPGGWALQDGVTFIIAAIDASGTSSMNLSIREADGGEGTPVGFEDLPATYNPVTGKWTLFFDTLQLPDGYYIVMVKAEDNLGHTSLITVAYSIRNWAVLELLPASETNKAGRTMPVKFALRVAASVDPDQPFVYNEDLTIEIFATEDPSNILQTSTFGDTARDYRINTVSELYITNFRTLRTPMQYAVTIYRGIFLIGSFEFSTTK